MNSFPLRPLIAIAAMAQNRVIGKDNKLPWHLPEDLRFFKAATLGHVLVMGRRTYESVGRPLPGRTTIVVSRDPEVARRLSGLDSVRVVPDWEQALSVDLGKTIFMAGGAQLYEQTLPWCGELLLTHVRVSPDGDVFFPEYGRWFDEGEIIESGACFTIRRHRRLKHT